MNADDLFTAPQVAKICSTDLKTIHNWVNRGEIRSFRTPGRHLRFRRQDIMEFLTKFGYPVPAGFTPTRQRVLVCDHDKSGLKSIQKLLSKNFDVDAYTDQVDALLAIGQNKPNLVLIHDNGEPNQDIVQLVSRLSSNQHNCPIAIYSRTTKNKTAAQQAGARDFIQSLDGKEIRKRITHLLGE